MNKIAKQSKDLYKEKIEQLKAIYPALFSDEGNLNEDELRNFLKQFASTSEGKYEFNWAGKMTAKRNAFTTSRAMLKPDKDRSINFDNTENLIIEGDNLEVLKLLQKSYQGKIKCIYIDPPYNTGNDFIYTDNFSEDKKAYWEKSGTTQDGVKLDTNTESQGRYHSNWLNMIYPRLTLSRNLLSEDGIIFISIDDNEIHNLRKTCDEVFGEENFIALLSVENNPKGRKNSDYVATSNDYCLIYGRNKALSYFIENIPKNIKDLALDENGKYVHKSGKRVLVGENTFNKILNNLKSEKHYSVYYHTISKDLILREEYKLDDKDKNLIENGYKRYVSSRDNNFIENTYTKDKFIQLYKENALEFQENKVFEKNYSNTIRIKSILQNSSYKAVINGVEQKYKIDVKTTSATQELQRILGNTSEIFTAPKNKGLLKILITLFEDKNFLILDFFAGSGTTAQAVMELNKEDGGNRKFILVQIPEKTDENSEAYKAGYKKISDICIERVKRVSKKLSEEKTTGDLGFKVFTLSPSYFPENLFTADPEKTEEENKKALAKYIEEASTQLEFKFDEFDLMYEVLLKDGFTLNFKAEKLSEFTKNNIYKVTDSEKHALITLDPDLKDETLQKLQSYTAERFLCLERAVDTTKKWNLQNMFGSNLWVI